MYNSTKYDQLQNKDWLKKELATKSMRLVANEVGCSYSAIVYYRGKYKIAVNGKTKKERIPLSFDRIENIKKALKKKYPNGRNGKLAANWKGGKRNAGCNKRYIIIHDPDHPYSTKDGYVMEHRLIVEKKLKRYLRKDEIIHHVNGDGHDNRLYNLKVMSKKEHSIVHNDAVKEVDRLKKILKKYKIKY